MTANFVGKLLTKPLRRGVGQRARREEGQAMVEFALTVSIMLFLIFGFIDFSRAIYAASVVQWAAQEGARAGIIDMATAEAAAHAKMTGLDQDRITVAVQQLEPEIVQVNVTYQFEFIVPLELIELMISAIPDGKTIELKGEASMVSQAQ